MSKKPRKKASISASARKPVAQPSAKRGASPGKARSLSTRKPTRKSGTAAKQAKPPRATLAQASKTPERESVKKSKALVEGAMAPPFRLPRDGGGAVGLSDFSGRKLVLFFYPRADTPGCTREAIDFTRLSGAFAESGTALLGVSADPPAAQEAFRDKHMLTVPLISDERHEMLEAYGAWGEKSMYGRTFLGIIRTTVLIGSNGRIKRIWRRVKVDGHAEEVLAAAREA